MITLELLAMLFGVFFASIGLAILLRPSYYTELLIEMLEHKAFFFLGGIISILLGVFVLHFYNLWEWNSLLLLTLIGWASILKGAFFLYCPNGAKALAMWILRTPHILLFGGGICVILGGILFSLRFSLT